MRLHLDRDNRPIRSVQLILQDAARLVEREPNLGFAEQQRRIATRYDKSVLSFESFLNLAAARLWLRSFVNTA